MSTKRKERIKLLEAVENIVGKTVQTDREMYNYSVRRENRKLEKMLKQLKEWREALECTQRLLESEDRFEKQKRKEKEAYADQRANDHQ